MKCPKCKKNMVTAELSGRKLFYCLRCDKAVEVTESELNRPTPTDALSVAGKAREVNVERLRAVPVPTLRVAKYGNRKTERHGLLFDSRKEADYYDELCMMEAAGEICELERQVKYPIVFNGVLICSYVADFVYYILPAYKCMVVDVKGYRTPMYRLKKKLMKACLGMDITEV